MKLLSIGEFSTLVGLSVSALRFYAESSLLIPAHVDQESGYRYYAPEQIALGRQVAHLRSLDLPLPELAHLLRAPSEVARVLERHEQRLYQEFQRKRQILREVGLLLDGQRQLPTVPVGFRTWPAQNVLSCVMNAEPEAFDAAYRACVAELRGHAQGQGLAATGMDFGLYHAREYWGGALQTEVCLPVEEVCPGLGPIRSSSLPETPVAYALHEGHWSTFNQTFAAVYLRAAEAGQRTGTSYTLQTPHGIELGFFLS